LNKKKKVAKRELDHYGSKDDSYREIKNKFDELNAEISRLKNLNENLDTSIAKAERASTGRSNSITNSNNNNASSLTTPSRRTNRSTSRSQKEDPTDNIPSTQERKIEKITNDIKEAEENFTRELEKKEKEIDACKEEIKKIRSESDAFDTEVTELEKKYKNEKK